MKKYITLFSFFLFCQNVNSSIQLEEESSPKRKASKVLKLYEFDFNEKTPTIFYSARRKNEKEIEFYEPAPEDFLKATTSKIPFHFTGKSPNFPSSQFPLMEMTVLLTPSFLKSVDKISYGASFFPARTSGKKALISMILPTVNNGRKMIHVIG